MAAFGARCDNDREKRRRQGLQEPSTVPAPRPAVRPKPSPTECAGGGRSPIHIYAAKLGDLDEKYYLVGSNDLRNRNLDSAFAVRLTTSRNPALQRSAQSRRLLRAADSRCEHLSSSTAVLCRAVGSTELDGHGYLKPLLARITTARVLHSNALCLPLETGVQWAHFERQRPHMSR